MTATGISSVKCPITKSVFKIVNDERSPMFGEFNTWIEKLLAQANSGQNVNIALDCEGFTLGSALNSLGCIQMGEIFNPSFNVRSSSKAPPIDVKGGFILLIPTSNNVKQMLTRLLNHEKTMLFTFDFTCDFSAMIDDGFDLKLRNVFDAQVGNVNTNRHIENVKVRGLKWFVEQGCSMDPYGREALNMLNYQKNFNFDLIQYVKSTDPHPFDSMISQSFLEMAAQDIYMTGLAAVLMINTGKSGITLRNSAQKVVEFYELNRKCNSPIAASLKRNVAFFNNYGIRNFQNGVNFGIRTDDEIGKLLSAYHSLRHLTVAYEILKGYTGSSLSKDKVENYFNQVKQTLQSIQPRLNQMVASAKW